VARTTIVTPCYKAAKRVLQDAPELPIQHRTARDREPNSMIRMPGRDLGRPGGRASPAATDA